MKIGTKIRELRQQAGISQEILARALSMTPQAVSRWENGTTAPDISLVPAIANYFGVSIDALFSYDTTLVQREIEEFFDQYYALLQHSEKDAQKLLRASAIAPMHPPESAGGYSGQDRTVQGIVQVQRSYGAH